MEQQTPSIDDYKKILKQLNNETERHSISVAEICKAIAEKEGLDQELSYKIGLVHDIGKLYIPGRILKKNGKLSGIEREVVDLHSYYGYRILKEYGENDSVYMPVLLHHGFGKAHLKLVDEQISVKVMEYTALVHSVDIYDAMTSKRAYHTPIDFDAIYKILSKDVLCTKELLALITEYDSYKQI